VVHIITAGLKSVKVYLLALNESTDSSDTAKDAIIFRLVDSEFNVTEEMAAPQSLEDTITSTNLELEKVMVKLRLGYSNLVSVVIDGKTSMFGLRNDLVPLVMMNMKSPVVDSSQLPYLRVLSRTFLTRIYPPKSGCGLYTELKNNLHPPRKSRCHADD
jgi:hypothetical protein